MKEVTWKRVGDGIARRLVDIRHSIAWSLPSNKMNQIKLFKFANIHENKRCFVIGNGPSLNQINFNYLNGEYTIGSNRVYLLKERLGFLPTYYVCVNELVLQQFGNEICQLKMPKFLNWNQRDLFDHMDDSINFIHLKYGFQDHFEGNLQQSLSGGGTVTYTALQIAYYMGFKEVILIGVDHNYAEKGIPNSSEIRNQKEDKSHFSVNYFPQGVKWQLPDLYRSEIAYRLARKTFEKEGRRIIDATAGGKCNAFEKIDFKDLF